MVNSVYIHIPFCEQICSYCDFTKFIYNENLANRYLEALEKEIKENYKNENIKTIYIGGGTPTALNYQQLEKLLDIIKIFKLEDNYEFTVECNPNVDLNKIQLLKKNKVNRVSLGMQTTIEKHLNFLNRNHTKEDAYKCIEFLKMNGFLINVDLIYALKDQTLKDLKNDLDFLIDLNIDHISTYSLIIENNTILKIKDTKNIEQELDFEMYNFINNYLKKIGFIHYEFSNYCKKGKESKHNLVYWNNQFYYGFGLSSGGYVDNVRYTNNNNIIKYIEGNYKKEEEKLSIETTMENEMILGLRKMEGVNLFSFLSKFGKSVTDSFYIDDLITDGKLVINNDYIKINPNSLYISNEILINFIDNFK